MRTLEDLQLDYVLESMDNPYNARLKKTGKTEYRSDFTTDDGDKVSVHFEGDEHIDDYDETDWEISFVRNGSQALTGEGDAMRIFATVIKLIREFIKKEKPVYFNLSAAKDDKDNTSKLQSREKLYGRLIKRYITGYNIQPERSRSGTTFYFTAQEVQMEMTTTSGVAGTGDDTDTVIVRRRKKKSTVQIARRLFPKK